MSYDQKVERGFLAWVAFECTDADAPSKGARYLKYYPANDIPSFAKVCSEDRDKAWRTFVMVKNIALDRGWIVEEEPISPEDRGRLRLTDRGFKRLDWHREQDAIPRLIRWLGTTSGVVAANLILPALVAWITVLISK